jgi:hypothetical protein
MAEMSPEPRSYRSAGDPVPTSTCIHWHPHHPHERRRQSEHNYVIYLPQFTGTEAVWSWFWLTVVQKCPPSHSHIGPPVTRYPQVVVSNATVMTPRHPGDSPNTMTSSICHSTPEPTRFGLGCGAIFGRNVPQPQSYRSTGDPVPTSSCVQWHHHLPQAPRRQSEHNYIIYLQPITGTDAAWSRLWRHMAEMSPEPRSYRSAGDPVPTSNCVH